jgi:hypothetical protein
MKLQAHIPTISIGGRDWHAATIALASLVGAAVLLLAIQLGLLLNNPLVERLRTASATRPHIGAFNRVSLDIHSLSNPIDPTRRFSVAHPLPGNVASSQPFSIGSDARVGFEVFGETAHSELLADEGTLPQLQPRNDRLMLMLVLLRLHPHRQ